MPLLKIASIDSPYVEVIALVPLFGKIKKGMKADVGPEQPIGGKHTARLVIVDGVLDAASGTFVVSLQLFNRNYKLSAGLRCQVNFAGID